MGTSSSSVKYFVRVYNLVYDDGDVIRYMVLTKCKFNEKASSMDLSLHDTSKGVPTN